MHIFTRQPVLRKVGCGKIKCPRNIEWSLPKPAVKIQNDARPLCAKWFDLPKNTLNIPQVIDQVREDNDIKRFVEFQKIMCISLYEFQFGMQLSGAPDHL